MALDNAVKVDLPEKGIVKQKVGNAVYAYYTLRAYRNDKGKPTSERISLGKIDEGTGKLMPNRNYYELYLKDSSPEVRSIKSYGLTYLIDRILKEMKLSEILRIKFPDLADQIIALAGYMLTEGNIMYYYENWSDETYPYMNVQLNSQQISRVFQGIDYKRRIDFFRTWIFARDQSEYVAYDVTSISSYSKDIEHLEWGYNRDGDGLPQLNLAMYYGERSQLPLYYNVYPGSITDKSHLTTMLQDNEMIGYTQTRFVLDRGFFSADNIQQLTSAGCRFVMSIPNSIQFAANMIDRHREEIVNRSECRMGKGLPYAKAVITEDFGMRGKLHIYYSPTKAARDEEALFDQIDKEELALSKMTAPPPKSMRYDRHFKINKSKDGSFGFIRDREKIDAAISRLGFFLILETDFRSTSEEILDIYRRRDIVEKTFNDLKNGLDMKRLYCKSDETMEGKVFVAFFSLIIRSFIHNKTKQYQLEMGLPFAAILKELNKLKFVCTTNGRRMLTPVTKKQRDILLACNVSAEDIPAWLSFQKGLGCIV